MQEGSFSSMFEDVGSINVCAEVTRLFKDHLGFDLVVNFVLDNKSTAGMLTTSDHLSMYDSFLYTCFS